MTEHRPPPRSKALTSLELAEELQVSRLIILSLARRLGLGEVREDDNYVFDARAAARIRSLLRPAVDAAPGAEGAGHEC